jgi:TolB protein
VTSVDGATNASITTTSGTFYYSWSSQDDLLFLSNAAAGLRLDLTSFDGSDLTDPRTVATGAPLYFSWDPDGGRMATHISLDRFELSDLDQATDLGPEPGVFQAPQWTDRGIVAVETHAGAPRLIVVSPDDGAVEPLATLIGPAYFVASPDGTRVAVQAITDEGDILSAIYQPIPAVPANRLAVVDTERAEVTSVTNGLVLAFFWSPDGTRLLVLDVTPDGVATWNVWDGDELREVVQFRPAETFVRNVLPFFDQYAQSMSLWSPDGSRFAFPGTIDGEEGIWVQPLDGERRLVSDGTWVSWSS